MKFIKSKNANINYLAKIVELNTFHDHPNPEVTRLKCAVVDGYNIIVGIDYNPGKFVYFPSGCTINPQFLSWANLYRHTEKNANSEKSGMFEDNGRVKSIRLKGTISEGFLLPLETLLLWISSETLLDINMDDFEVNTEFDTFEHNGKSFWINKKFVIASRNGSSKDSPVRKGKKLSRVIEKYFPEHYETVIIRKCPDVITPNSLIQLTSKWHGTSLRSGYVLVKKELSFFDKLCNLLEGKSWNEDRLVYDYLYGSRRVVKNQYYNETVTGGYYGVDLYKDANEIIKPCLQKGMMIFSEIVGFKPDGGFIQGPWDYGCVPPKSGETYTHGIHFKVVVYRITLTNIDGYVHEFSAREVQQYCEKFGLTPVTELYYGYAKDLYPDLEHNDEWNKNFIERLADDKNFYMEMNSPDCNNPVPHEGVVIKTENSHSFAAKLKCFNFLNKEGKMLDAGESNMEDEN